jgi:thiamine biosynthesis protein ThiS
MDSSPTIRLLINGEPRSVPAGVSLEELLGLLGLEQDRVAIEYNLSIIHRGRWAEVKLSDADRLEIVQFVGGG